MWNYSTTEATSVRATSASSTSSAQYSTTTRDELHSSAESATVAVTLFASSGFSESHNNHESATTVQTFGSDSQSISNSPGGLATQSASEGITQVQYRGFTRSSTGFTSAAGGLSTTSSTQITTTRSLDSYASTTTTQTVAVNSDTTTTYTETRAITTSAAGPTTTTASETITNTTSTTTPATITRTTYAYAPSTTLAAPVSLVPVSEANATEQAWQATATADRTAGYPSHVADSFTKRAGTYTTASTSLSAASSQGFTTVVTNATGGVATLTLTTTSTLSTQDTYVPTAGSYPATSTTTRAFTLLTTATTTLAVGTSTTNTTSFTFQSTNYVLATTTFATNLQLLVPITINQSPTSTLATSFHLTYGASTTAQIRTIRPQATSASASTADAFTGTTTQSATTTYDTTTNTTTNTTTSFSTTQSYGTTTSTTTTSTMLEPDGTTVDVTTVSGTITFSEGDYPFFTETTVSGFTTYTIFEYWTSETGQTTSYTSSTSGITEVNAGFVTTRSTLYTFEIYTETSSESYSSLWFDGINFTNSTTSSSSAASSGDFSQSDTVSDTFPASTITFDTTTTRTSSLSETTTLTATTTATSFTDTTAFDTTTASAPYSQSSGSSYTQSEGISYTYPILNGLTTATASTPWTAHAMHPRQGFRHPLSLASSDAMFSVMSILPSGLAYPPQATQDDASGPATPILYPRSTSYTVGGVAYTAAWSLGDSRLHVTSGATSDTTTATATFSFSGATPATWYFPKISSAAAQGSLVGGIPAKSEFGVAIYFPSGVRHWTLQQGGISSSETSWLTSPDTSANSSDGFALPATVESAWSVTKRQTSWTYDFFASAAQSTGNITTPIMTLSLNPNL